MNLSELGLVDLSVVRNELVERFFRYHDESPQDEKEGLRVKIKLVEEAIAIKLNEIKY